VTHNINNTLLMTVGLPRSGKSTWVKAQNCPIVNNDAIRLALHGKDFVQEAEDMVHAIAVYMVKALFLAGHNTVVLDETNMNIETRALWKSPQWKRRYQYFDTPPELCKMRAIACEERGEFFKGYGEVMREVIDRKHAAFEPIEKWEWD
jgi:predicted kinase